MVVSVAIQDGQFYPNLDFWEIFPMMPSSSMSGHRYEIELLDPGAYVCSVTFG